MYSSTVLGDNPSLRAIWGEDIPSAANLRQASWRPLREGSDRSSDIELSLEVDIFGARLRQKLLDLCEDLPCLALDVLAPSSAV